MEATIHSNLPAGRDNFLTAREATKTARLAGILFFCLCLPLAIWGETYVAGKIFVAHDPVATANNLLSNESIFRISIVGHLAGTIIFVLMVMLLYRLFRPVDKHLSRLMIAFVLAQIPVVMILEVFNIAALMILKSEGRPTFDVAQQQEVAYFLLRIHRYGTGTGKFFFGLCYIPWGMLVLRSRFMPRIFGILLLINGVGYVAHCFTYILLQRPEYLIVVQFLRFTTLGFISTLLWMVIKGIRYKE
jgi:hypothetical protein